VQAKGLWEGKGKGWGGGRIEAATVDAGFGAASAGFAGGRAGTGFYSGTC